MLKELPQKIKNLSANIKFTSLGWTIVICGTWISGYIEYRFGSNYDGGPPITAHIAFYLFFPISIILLALGSRFQKVTALTVIFRLLIISSESLVAFVIIAFLLIVWCQGGCM